MHRHIKVTTVVILITVTIVGSLVTIYSLLKEYMIYFSDLEAKFVVIILSIITTYYFFENLYLRAFHRRNALYGEILETINIGFSSIHELQRNVRHIDLNIICLKKVCTNLAKAFTLITSTKCSVSIKLFYIQDSERPKVVTLCRDIESEKSRTIDEERYPAFIDENTAFKTILTKIHKAKPPNFLSNKLPLLAGYENTSIECYGRMKESVKNPMRIIRWSLPYKSTLVVPIIPLSSRYREIEYCVGFLCVDSTRMFAFKYSNDYDLISGFADGIYNTCLEIIKEK